MSIESNKVFVITRSMDWGEIYLVKVFTDKAKAETLLAFLKTRDGFWQRQSSDEPPMYLGDTHNTLPEERIINPAHDAWVKENPYHEHYGYDNYELEEVEADFED